MSLPPLDDSFTIEGHSPRKLDSEDENESKNVKNNQKDQLRADQIRSLRVSWNKRDKPLVSKQLVESSLRNPLSTPAANKHPSQSNRSLYTPCIEDIKCFEKLLRRFPEKAILDIFRNHFANVGEHTRHEYFRRAIRWRRGTASTTENYSCVICRMQKYASRPIQAKCENIVSSLMLYPPHYYNRYSREEKKIVVPDDKKSCIPNLIQISKKIDLAFKSRGMPTPPPPPPVSVLESLPPLTPCPESGCSNSRTDNTFSLYQAPMRRPVHRQCKPHTPNYLPGRCTDSGELAEVYNRQALKGSFPPKHLAESGERGSKCEYQLTYPINSLGLKVNIPVYNSHFRPIAPFPSRITADAEIYKKHLKNDHMLPLVNEQRL